MHIAGVVVRTRPISIVAVQQRIQSLAGAEVHVVSPEGRLVVTVEGCDRSEVADMIYQLDRLEGVLSASMAYEHSDYDPKQPEASE
jgi:periplasmic nitrate reductase NapD